MNLKLLRLHYLKFQINEFLYKVFAIRMLTVEIRKVDTAVPAKTVFKATVKTPVKTSTSVQAATNAQNSHIVIIQKADMTANV